MDKPSVGRIVHYVSHGTPGGEFPQACRAAIVTETSDLQPDVIVGRVGLCVLNPTGLFLRSLAAGGCAQDEDEHVGGSWHWPERV